MARLTPDQLQAIDSALNQVRTEMVAAFEKHRPMHSPHEGYGVILEEVDELFDEVKANNLPRAKEEAVQVAAMATRFIVDL